MNDLLPTHYYWRKRSEAQDDDILHTLLKNRGIEGEAAERKFLNPTKADLYDPFLMSFMNEAVDRILAAKQNKESVVIFGDYDVDGVTSTSILYMFLKELGMQVTYYIPNRQTEGYGLNKEAITALAKTHTLLITVDTGIAAFEEVAWANTLGLTCIITDHHECQDTLPKAYCILNPKLPGNTYPFSNLAGVGVTFKLIQGLARKLDCEEKIWKYLDITALGTVADVVPLVDENRVITALGFLEMPRTVHVGLRALLDIIPNKGDKMTTQLIGYQLGPRLNAAGRLEDAKIGVRLLSLTDSTEAKQIAETLDQINKERQQMESDILEEAYLYIEQHIDLEKEKILVVIGEGWHHGVIGIVASRIMNKYYRPTVILSLEDGVYSGSARSIEGFNIFEAIHAQKDDLLRFGGHEMAAGLSVAESQFEHFKAHLLAYSNPLLTPQILTPALDIDTQVHLKDLTLDLYDQIEKLEPFGTGNPTPIFSIKASLQSVNPIGDGSHLRVVLWQDGSILNAVAFGKGSLFEYLSEGEAIEVAGEITQNRWNNKVTLQLRIKDMISPPANIRKSKYYLSLYKALKEPPLANKILNPSAKSLPDEVPLAIYTEKGQERWWQNLEKTKKAFTTFGKICYNKMQDTYQEGTVVINPLLGDTTHYIAYDLPNYQEQVQKMVPSYVDCRAVYKLLKENKKGYVYLHKLVEALNAYQMTEYKALQSLDIFKELGFLTYIFTEECIHYTLLPAPKTPLENSKRYQHLQHFLASYASPKI
jgi:single-stranded-DNA-specific exonuclease